MDEAGIMFAEQQIDAAAAAAAEANGGRGMGRPFEL
jgi:hypothetical protein